jgi:hypothetical protein
MGFVVSVLYLVVNYLTPPTVFGPLAAFRVELILAMVITVLSIPTLARSIVLKTPQSLALIGLAFAGSLSILFGQHWLGGAVQAFPAFFPCAFAYFLVCLHCNSKRKLQAIVLMLLFVCLFVIAHGYIDLLHGVAEGNSVGSADSEASLEIWNSEHPYLLAMKSGGGESFYRLKGLGLINDPNDFGQLLVCVIPLVFILWRPKNVLRNLTFVVLPVSVLLYGTYLTHSRGALLALLAMAVVAARRRIGTLPALLLASGLFVAAMSLHFTGGREISANSGSDRTELWSESLQLLKSHPLFGVGIGNLSDYLSYTAHNSVMVCAAELGFVGLFFWSLFLFSTVRDALEMASSEKVSEGKQIIPEEGRFHFGNAKIEALNRDEVNRLGRLLVLSLTGLLVAGWFLSRAYVITLFLLGGIVEVVYEMALQRGMISHRLRLARLLPLAVGLAISLVLLMYIVLRVSNLMR